MANSALKDMAEEYNDVSDKVQHFQEKLNKIVEHAAELKQQLLDSNIDLVVLHDYMTQEAAKVVENLQKEFDTPLPDEMDERTHHREEMISKGIDGLEVAFVDVCVQSGRMSEEDARRAFGPIKVTIHDWLLIAGMFQVCRHIRGNTDKTNRREGNIVDKHPVLVETIIISAVCLLIPEGAFLRPILSAFGFGPTGPIKGTPLDLAIVTGSRG